MDEAHFAEIEKVMLYVTEARERCEKAARSIAKQGGEPHLVTALETAEQDLLVVHRHLMQGTLFAVPDDQLAIKS